MSEPRAVGVAPFQQLPGASTVRALCGRVGYALLLLTPLAFASTVPGGNGDTGKVTLAHHGENYDFDNGNVKVTVNGPTATVTDFRYHGTDFINSVGKHDAIYWSMDGGASYQNPSHASCTVKTDTPDMADVGCKAKYDGSQPHAFDIDIHYVLRRGNTGLYVYAILSHPANYPDTSVGEWRIVWQTPQVGDKWLLEKIYVDQTRHWLMPTPADMSQRIATPIKEISFFRNGTWANKGESKYTYNATYEDIGAFGFASDIHKLGAWTVLGSFEYYNDGPRKQDLTGLEAGMTHHFGRNHYGDTGIHVAAGESWSKVFGPFLLYLNAGGDGDTLWHDAQQQAATEQAAWPYAWLTGIPEYPSAAERGSVSGKFTVSDKLKPSQTGAHAWIGLTQPPPGLDFQSETKNYQYWSHVAPDGSFKIPNARPGSSTPSSTARPASTSRTTSPSQQARIHPSAKFNGLSLAPATGLRGRSAHPTATPRSSSTARTSSCRISTRPSPSSSPTRSSTPSASANRRRTGTTHSPATTRRVKTLNRGRGRLSSTCPRTFQPAAMRTSSSPSPAQAIARRSGSPSTARS
jgi:hypothetical protein